MDSDNYYNLGVVYFQKKEFDEALDYFLNAIEIDENLDSYLYTAVSYRELGEKEKALQYFRERVSRMTGEDDHYAREAMQGIRDRVVLSTKNGHYNKKEERAWWLNLENSLKRLRTDVIDIYNFL